MAGLGEESGPTQAMTDLSIHDVHDEARPRQIPAPNPVGIIAFEITSKFHSAAQALAPGELVKDGFFTLFESVGALEIMDPKMDSGVLRPGESLDEEYDVSRALSPEEVLGIMDQLLCHEMAWHVGYPLSQTILTSVYVEAMLIPAPSTLKDAHFLRGAHQESSSHMQQVLRAYCLGLLKSCGLVNERIMLEHYYEEEDFMTNTYHRNLLDKFPSEAVQSAIEETITQLRGLASKIPEEMLRALENRLHFRNNFLEAIESIQHRNQADDIRGPWQKLVDVLESIQKTHFQGRPVVEAFSVKLQRRLASTVPPRPIVELRFEDAFHHFTRLAADGLEVIDVLKYHDAQCLQTFVTTFQATKPQPLIFIRTMLQSFLFKDMEVLGHMSIRQLIDDDLSIVTLPASILLERANDEIEAVQDPRFIVAEQMEIFRKKAAQPYLDILRTCCQNRCRIRRTLCHIIRDWENLQFDAEDIDQILQLQIKEKPVLFQAADGSPVETYSLPLSSWAFYYKLKQMEWIVQLGFELEVYQTDELAGMYWYLQYLSKLRLQHVERIKSFIVRKFNDIRTENRRLTAQEQAEFTRSLAFIRHSLLDAAVTCELSDALSCLYTALHRLALVKPPPRPCGTDELRYELRMKPFAVIGHPALPTFQEFKEGTEQPDQPTESLLWIAEKATAGARRGLEAISKLSEVEAFSVASYHRWLPGVKNSLKSCIAAGLAVSAVQKAMQHAGEEGDLKIRVEIPTPDKAYHEFWIVPKAMPIR